MICILSEPKMLIPESETEYRAMQIVEYLKSKARDCKESPIIATNSEIQEILVPLVTEYRATENTRRFKKRSPAINIRQIKKEALVKATELFPSSISIHKSETGRKETGIIFTPSSEMDYNLELNKAEIKTSDVNVIEAYEYPSFEDIAYLFSRKLQKEKNQTVITYRNVTMRRDLMLKILERYHNQWFTFEEVKHECNDREGDENFLRHWEYLLNNNFIEKTESGKFKFCDRVKEWKYFK